MAAINAAGAHTQHPGMFTWTCASNGARASIAVLDQPTKHLAHWAHYYDAPTISDDYRAFAVRQYLAAIEAVGALG